MKNYTFKVDADVIARLQAIQERDGVTVSEQIRRSAPRFSQVIRRVSGR